MAVLTSDERATVQAQFCSDVSTRREPFNVNEPDLTAGVAAIDDWIEANQQSFLNSLPAAFRTGTTLKNKLDLFTRVANKRYLNS